MQTGIVKWFSESKGCGFIEDLEGRNVFVKDSSFANGTAELSEGQEVSFELVETDRGPEASRVVTKLEE